MKLKHPTAPPLTSAQLTTTAQPKKKQGGYPCDRCDKVFIYPGALRKHRFLDHVLFTCETCQAKFTSVTLLARHIRLNHRKRQKNDDDDDEKKKKKKKKQKRNARRRVDYLSDEGDEPEPDRENDDRDIAEVIARNWGAVKNHSRVGKKQTFINVRWRGDNTPDFNAALQPFFQNTKTKFKIQASHGFVLKKNDDDDDEDERMVGNYRYFHSSDRNAGLFDLPKLIKDNSDFRAFIDSMREVDHLEACRQQRPNSKFTVERITNTSFVIDPIPDHPIGNAATPIPEHLTQNRSLITLVTDKNGRDLRDDAKCFFRCLALHRGAKPEALETRAGEYFDEYLTVTARKHFDGVTLSELAVCENLFGVRVDVFEFDEEEEEALVCVRRSCDQMMKKKKNDNEAPLRLLLYHDHFCYIKNLQQLSKSFACAKCGKLDKRHWNMKQHEDKCNGVGQRNVYAGGVYRPPPTPLEILHQNGIDVDTKAVFPYRATYDFESYFDKSDLPPTTAKTRYTARHVPLSVSVCSNVPSFQDPKFFLNTDGVPNLISDFVDYLETISAHSFELMRERYADAYRQIADRQAAEDLEPERRLGLPASTLTQILDAYLQELIVVGFNSSNYDLNLIKTELFGKLTNAAGSDSSSSVPAGEEENAQWVTNGGGELRYLIKNGHQYKCIATRTLKILDCCSYLAPGCSYAKYLTAFDVDEEKGFWPYEYIDSLERINETQLPPPEAFRSRLKGNKDIHPDDYAHCQKVWREHGMRSMRDFLRWYNNKDVVPFLEALDKQVEFFRSIELDMFKDGIGIPGLTLRYLHKSMDQDTYLALFSKHQADVHTLIRQQLVGGPSIVFSRYKEKGQSTIRGGKPVDTLEGYDANALYLWAISQTMPTGHPVIRRKETNFIPCRTGKFGLLAREWLEWEQKTTKRRIDHQFNVGEKRLGSRNIPVDGWDPVNHTAYQFHGCRFHGCPRCSVPHPFKPDATPEELFEKTQEITRYLRETLGVTVIEVWECEWQARKKSNPLIGKYLKTIFKYNYRSPFKEQKNNNNNKQKKTKIDDGDVVEAVKNGRLFGLVRCDVEVPDNLRAFFAEMTPVFKNVEISREDIGTHMKDFATTHNLLSTPRPALIGSYFGKDMLFATPLLRWYIQHGLVVSNVSLIVEYEPTACFQKFAERVTKERRRGDMDKAYAIIAEMFKLLGNSAYGKTITNIAKHADVTFVSDKDLGKKVAHPLWKNTTPLGENLNEVETLKSKLVHRLPSHVGFFVYQLAKLRMLDFHFECVDKYIDRSNYELCEMDTDSLYMVLSTASLEEAVRPELRRAFFEEYHHWFPSECCDDHRQEFVNCKTRGEAWVATHPCCLERKALDKRTPGLFKLEYKGDGIVALCSKTYCCFGANATTKTSAKGISKRLNKLTRKRYLKVLKKQISGKGHNVSFKHHKAQIYTYKQSRASLSYFYIKRRVHEDRVTTSPLNI